MDDKVTTLLPTYRRPKMLNRAILSILNQTHQNVQVCVFDDSSGDETEHVVCSLMKKDGRVKYYHHPNNIGALANFKFAFNHVDPPFFSILSNAH